MTVSGQRSEPIRFPTWRSSGRSRCSASRWSRRVLAIPQSAGLTALNLPPATVNRKFSKDELLAPDQSERVVGMARLIGQLQAMVEDSGDPANFDATAWLSRWLREPLPAFGGAPPFDYMDTMEGQALVSQALGQTQSGAYA